MAFSAFFKNDADYFLRNKTRGRVWLKRRLLLSFRLTILIKNREKWIFCAFCCFKWSIIVYFLLFDEKKPIAI